MNSSNTNKQSTSAGDAGDASLSTPPSVPQVRDKENFNPNHDHPMFQNLSKSNQQGLHGEMYTYNRNLPLNSRNKWAFGSKGPSPVKARRSDLRGDPHINANQGKSPRKRSALMADMDDSPPPPKRPRPEVPFLFMKDLTLFDENPAVARRIFLDILEAQQRRELYPENEEKIPFLVPSVDNRDLCGNESASRKDARLRAGSDEAARSPTENEAGHDQSISVSQDDSVFGSLHRDLLIWEDLQYPKKTQDRPTQMSGDRLTTTHKSDLLHEQNRVDAVEATTDCGMNGFLPSSPPLPTVEEATEIGLPEVDSNADNSPVAGGSTFEPRPPLMAQPPVEEVPEASQLPKAKASNLTRERERSTVQSNGIVGTGMAGPSNTSSTPFAYSKARADEIWEHACAKDYLGAHALFDPRERVTIISGEEKVRRYLNEHPEMKARLREPTNGRPRERLYFCGASAIWRRVENPKKSTAGEPPEYELTYEPCHDCGYASMDNYKKHVYRHHLGKFYKQYSWK